MKPQVAARATSVCERVWVVIHTRLLTQMKCDTWPDGATLRTRWVSTGIMNAGKDASSPYFPYFQEMFQGPD